MVVRHSFRTTAFHSSIAVLRILLHKHIALDLRDISPLGDIDSHPLRNSLYRAVDPIDRLFSIGYDLQCHSLAIKCILPAFSGPARVPREWNWVCP